MSDNDVLTMSAAQRIEVYTGTARRRRWSAGQKAEIVEESYATSVGEAAARHGVSRGQLFNWRRQMRGYQPRLEFAAVEIDRVGTPSEHACLGMIEIALDGGIVRVSPGADRKMATTIIMALRASVR